MRTARIRSAHGRDADISLNIDQEEKPVGYLGSLGMKIGVGAAALALALPSAIGLPDVAIAQEAAPSLQRGMVSVNGRDRAYSYHISSRYRPDAFNFVVYVLPDNGQSADAFARQTGWIRLSDQHGFAVVFLQPEGREWAPNSGGEDAYVKAVYDHAATHLTIGRPGGAPGAPGDGRGGGQPGAAAPGGPGGAPAGEQAEAPRPARPAAGAQAEAGPAGPGAGAGGPGGPGGPGGARVPRAQTWAPFHYVTGAGAGATVAQEFVINHPGVFAAIATLDGAPFDAAYAHGGEPAQGYFQNLRGGKNATPVWRQLKREVPVAAWLFTTGAPLPAEARVIDYWRRGSAVAQAAQTGAIAGFDTAVYRNAANPAQQVRTTIVGEVASYDEALARAIWNDFFAHTARWTSSPNGDLGPMLTQAEVESSFDVRRMDISGRNYSYYVRTPSSYRAGQSLPVVLAAPGAFYPAWMYLSQIRMHEVGEREGFITVYVNGPQNRWEFTDPDGPDAQFLTRVVDDVATRLGADRGRVYMQGFSLGSGMAYMMGITHPALFAAVSPNNGIGPMSPAVLARVAELKARGDVRIPMMMVYGDVDSGGSTDARIPANGVLRGAIDEMKAYNRITTPDRVEPYLSPNTFSYDVLVPGARPARAGVDRRYPQGRFQISPYMSADPVPLNLFSFIWVTDMTHGQDPRTAQLEWDYFRQWRRNPDGTLTHGPARPTGRR
jgi:poly(3-hydroxybutyrate) depolymerase